MYLLHLHLFCILELRSSGLRRSCNPWLSSCEYIELEG